MTSRKCAPERFDGGGPGCYKLTGAGDRENQNSAQDEEEGHLENPALGEHQEVGQFLRLVARIAMRRKPHE